MKTWDEVKPTLDALTEEEHAELERLAAAGESLPDEVEG